MRETGNSGILLARDRREDVGRDQSLSNAVAEFSGQVSCELVTPFFFKEILFVAKVAIMPRKISPNLAKYGYNTGIEF